MMSRLLTVCLVLSLLGLTACEGAPAAGSGPIAPQAVQPSQSPAEVVSTFLSAWNDKNFDAMYNLISPESQQKYAQQVFKARYQVADDAMNFAGVTFSLKDTRIQGVTAAVNYDVQINSPNFGSIQDPGRTMRLVQTPQGWRIAWSSMDIFPNLVADGRIRVDSDFPPRANIYDHNGNVLVEENGTIVVLWAIKQDISSLDNCLDLLRRTLRRPRAELAQLFANYNPDTYFYVGEIDPEVYRANQQDLANLCAMSETDSVYSKVTRRQSRRYVGYGAFAHVTGYVGRVPAAEKDFWQAKGYQESDIVGLAGIERAYEDTLAGKAERYLRIVEPGGATLRQLAGTQGAQPTPIMLTIDRDLQLTVAQAISDAFNYAQPNWGGVSTGAAAVVIDVNTGAIRALVSYPNFNPTIFNPDTPNPNALDVIGALNSSTLKPLVDKVVQEQYSPGSTFKIITSIAAASEGVIGLDDVFYCDLQWDGTKHGDKIRYDWRKTDKLDPTGDVVLSQALTASCDPFFYEMGARLYEKNPTGNLLASYAQRLGLGTPLGILGLDQSEAPGNLAPPDNITSAVNDAIGQGNVQIPPIQMAQMVAAVANGGTLYKTYLVQQIGGMDGAAVTFQAQPQIVRQLNLRPEVIQAVQDGMCQVTTNRKIGTAEFVFGNAPYGVCGKTGTAQTAYYPNGWFVAYAMPTRDSKPELAIAVMVANSREGSEVAGPIVRRILDIYYNAKKVIDYPDWWNQGPYHPLEIPEGGTGGG